MVVDVDVVAIKEEVGGACFALVIVGACFLHLCASAMWAFNYFDTFTHVCFSNSLRVCSCWVCRLTWADWGWPMNRVGGTYKLG